MVLCFHAVLVHALRLRTDQMMPCPSNFLEANTYMHNAHKYVGIHKHYLSLAVAFAGPYYCLRPLVVNQEYATSQQSIVRESAYHRMCPT